MEEKKLNLHEDSLENADGGAYIPANVISITDGQIFLTTDIGRRGADVIRTAEEDRTFVNHQHQLDPLT